MIYYNSTEVFKSLPIKEAEITLADYGPKQID